MKKVLVFGLGERGKQLVDHYLYYNGTNDIVAIIDNYTVIDSYHGIPVIKPEDITFFTYDEIWVCTVYYSEIRKQLMAEYHISEQRIIYVDPVMPILEERLRKRYGNLLNKVPEDLQPLLEYMENHPARMYCYPFFDEYTFRDDTAVCFDEQSQLFYVYYDSKRMYFSKQLDSVQKVRSYYNSILMEQDSRSPHCYWNDDEMKKLSGVGLDVGSAEGIFALKIIEQVEHIYLIEIDRDWIEALECTFRPYKDKVTIVPKFVSDQDEGICIRLDSLMEGRTVNFIKMDIEGEEQKALAGCHHILTNNNVQIAVCVYHRQEDNERIGNLLLKYGYQIKNSEGYVICQGEWELKENNTDFRKALLFAHKEG